MNVDAELISWLLDSDPAIRWQVKRDLLDAPTVKVAADRAGVAREGWGASVLSQQREDGTWTGCAWNHGWDSTMHALWLLREFGLDPATPAARQAVDRVREKVKWGQSGPEECAENPFFTGEVEPCINGQVAAAGAYFGQDVSVIIDRLVTETLNDGGWNCYAEYGSSRSSFNSTIDVLEALQEYERVFGFNRRVSLARQAGEEFLLKRQLQRRLSTGMIITHDRDGGAPWSAFTFPTWWHYDVLRGLEYFRCAGGKPDARLDEALDLVESKRRPDGRWNLDLRFEGRDLIDLGESEGQASRWITLKALRVLRWGGRLA